MLLKPEFSAVPSPILFHPVLSVYKSSPPLGAPACMTQSEGDEKEK